MSDAAERPDVPQGEHDAHEPLKPRPDADAWATAAAEDLAAEKARRRARQGPQPGSAAEELRRLVETVADRLSGLSSGAAPLIGMAAQGAAQQMLRQAVQQAKAAVEPVIERNPDVFGHLAAAGSELLAAYRSAVTAQEGRWTAGPGPEARAGGRRKESTGDQDVRGRTGGDGHPQARDADADDPEDRPNPPGHAGDPKGSGRRDEDPGPGEHIDLDCPPLGYGWP